MTFIPDNLSAIVQPIGGEGLRFFSYRTDDDIETVTGLGYFAAVEQFGVRFADLIFVTPVTGLVESYVTVVNEIDGEGDGTVSRATGQSNVTISIEDFGARTTRDDNASYIQAALDSGAGVVVVPVGEYKTGNFLMPPYTTLQGMGWASTLMPIQPPVGSALSAFIKTKVIDEATPARSGAWWIKDLRIDGSLRSWPRWLSKADGTPVTDPEADYVMGTGALASGISGVSLTPVIASGVITGITIVNGGAGWKGHSTKPYIPDNVTLKFTDSGGGRGARAYAVISGGTLTSTVIETGGTGYTGATTVKTMGGYADPDILVFPEIDRRNANHDDIERAISATKVDGGGIVNVLIEDYGNSCINDSGCRNFQIDVMLRRCLKNDQAFHGVWVQNYGGTPDAPSAGYAPSESCDVTVKAYDCERIPVLFAPPRGNNRVCVICDGVKEGGLYISTNANQEGGVITIDPRTSIRGVRMSDIVAHGIEIAGQVKNVFASGIYVEDTDDQALTMAGTSQSHFSHCVFKNCYGDVVYPYGPFSERFSFGAGTRPLCGTNRAIESGSYVTIGTVSANTSNGTKIEDCVFEETRSLYPGWWFNQTKSGASSVGLNTVVRRNQMIGPPGMVLLNDATGTVWADTRQLHMYENVPYDLAGTSGVGTRSIYIPHSQMAARTTNGAAPFSAEVGGVTMIIGHAFDAAVNEAVQFSLELPRAWNCLSVTFKAHWTARSGTGAVKWNFFGRSVTDGEVINASFGTGTTVTDTLIAVDCEHVSSATANYAVISVPTAGDRTIFSISRDATDATDTLAVDAILIGVTMNIVTSKLTDD